MKDSVDVLDQMAVKLFCAELASTIQHPISTGLADWDKVCDETGGAGLGDWWYVVIGGGSNSGKTNLALHLLMAAAMEGRMPSLISLETPRKGIQRKLYSCLTTLGYYDMLPINFHRGAEEKTARLTTEIAEYRRREPRFGASMYVIEHKSKPTLRQIMDDVDDLRQNGSKLIILDHLQLVRSDQRSAEIAAAATEVSEALREYAHTHSVCIVGLSQLNRTASSQRDRQPTMHDLWGGTSMESNANQVMMIDHSRQAPGVANHLLMTYLILDKNREGPARIHIPVEIDFKTGVWRQAEPHEEDLWPE